MGFTYFSSLKLLELKMTDFFLKKKKVGRWIGVGVGEGRKAADGFLGNNKPRHYYKKVLCH